MGWPTFWRRLTSGLNERYWGYGGSYARVAAFIRQWRAGRETAQRTTGRGVFVPLAFQPGEAFQFDWSEDWATVGGRRVKL